MHPTDYEDIFFYFKVKLPARFSYLKKLFKKNPELFFMEYINHTTIFRSITKDIV